MDFAAFLAKLNIRLGDNDNFAFSPEEKTEQLTEAFRDAYVIKSVWDSTLSVANGTYSYTLPVTLSTIRDIYITPSTSSNPEKISIPWELDAPSRTIRFISKTGFLPTGQVLYLKGDYKYLTSDTIPNASPGLQEYILDLAQLKAMKNIGTKKVLKFLKNDVSMSDIVTLKRELEREVAQYRQRLPRDFQTA